MTPEQPRKPALVWFKAQAPGIRSDGSSLVTMRIAAELSADYELHLVCLRTPSTTTDPTTACVPPFTSVTVAETPHQRSAYHRFVLGIWYWLLDRTRRRPLASSIEGAQSVVGAVAKRIDEVNGTVGIVEYWSARAVLDAMPADRTTLILHDIEHAAVDVGRSSRQKMILREELAACRTADRVVFLSNEDHEAFSSLGVSNGTTVLVPVTDVSSVRQDQRNTAVVAFLGHLTWGPNARGLDWFLEQVWPTVRRRRADAQVLVVGRAEGRPDADGVSYAGFVEDLPAALATADVGVVPTLDGSGVKTKTLDLLAAGLPLVSTVNGARGTSASTAGALITDDPSEFAEFIVALLDDPERRLRLVEDGRTALTAQHSPKSLAERLLP